jgi:hypothetical protein
MTMDEQTMPHSRPLPAEEAELIEAWWRAANYLSVGQIYLLDNPLIRDPLRIDHVKPRLLVHWGTTPGLNFVYVHLNRIIKARGLNTLFIAGPGHGAPGVVANTWLEGTYSELYPAISSEEEGLRRLFRQFSFGGSPAFRLAHQPSANAPFKGALSGRAKRRHWRSSRSSQRTGMGRTDAGLGPVCSIWTIAAARSVNFAKMSTGRFRFHPKRPPHVDGCVRLASTGGLLNHRAIDDREPRNTRLLSL